MYDVLVAVIMPLQVAFASDFIQMWDGKSLGLTRAKGTVKLTFLVPNILQGLQQVAQSAIPSLYPVRGNCLLLC